MREDNYKMRRFLVCFLTLSSTVVYGQPNKGYIKNKANGVSYRLVYQAQPWDKARQLCVEEGAKLAVPRSEEEFSFIQKLVRGMSYHDVVGSDYKLLVWLGVNNLDHYTTWKNIDGENIETTGFSRWSGSNGEAYSDAPSEPHCVGVDAHNPGFREFWCSRHQPYICQRDSAST